MNARIIKLQQTVAPRKFEQVPPVLLTDETLLSRKNKILAGIAEENFDALIVYADKEHGGNFEYLTGFIPRFEEGLLILNKNGQATAILGNENLKMASHSRIEVTLKHSPYFSLPNQPMDNEKSLEDLFAEADLHKMARIGLVGWKMFTSTLADNKKFFDLPYFIVEAIKNSLSPHSELENAAHLFIHGEKGARSTCNANEIAHYEYGANLASNCILDAMNAVEPGVTEAELGQYLSAEGQYNTVVVIAATSPRFEKANLYPSYKRIEKGQPLSLTTAFKGGLSSRTGFVVTDESELPAAQKDYLERVAKPYFAAIATWLERIAINMPGSELYNIIEQVLPQDKFGWHLNPGHLTADEEWMSSPIYPGSAEKLASGMMLQIDIIPSIAGYTGSSAEECIALADASLQQEIRSAYPELWQRICARRDYIINTLNINLSKDVLPLSNTVAYLRPFLLAKDKSLVK